MTIKPTHHRVLISIVATSDSAIVRPEDVTPLSSDIKTVLAIGPDVTCCKVGDRIMLRPDARNFIGTKKNSETDFECLISDDIIVAVIEGELEVSK